MEIKQLEAVVLSVASPSHLPSRTEEQGAITRRGMGQPPRGAPPHRTLQVLAEKSAPSRPTRELKQQ
jgi:hypothetical protein